MRLRLKNACVVSSTLFRCGDGSMAVLLETTLGDIVIDLFTEERPKSKNIYITYNLIKILHAERRTLIQTRLI